MKLGVLDRLLLLNILPKEGDLTNMRIVRDMHDSLAFTEPELELLKFETDAEKETTNWQPSVVDDKDIELSPLSTSLVIEKLKKMIEEKKLTVSYLSLYDKFVRE